jgi:hypothetical protein
MGIPITHTCALDGCEVLSSSATGWFFDVVDLFTPRTARRERSSEVGARRAWLLAESHRQAADAPCAAEGHPLGVLQKPQGRRHPGAAEARAGRLPLPGVAGGARVRAPGAADGGGLGGSGDV